MKDKAKYWHVKTFLGSFELLHAHFVNQKFSRHYHDGYGIGVIEKGAMEFFYRGDNLIAPHGQVNTVNPHEVHDGKSASGEEGWVYRMLYFSPEIMRRGGELLDQGPLHDHYITKGVINDTVLAGMVGNLHVLMEDDASDKMEVESALVDTITRVIRFHSDKPEKKESATGLGNKIKIIKDYMNTYYSGVISLEELSGLAGVTPFHLIRSFKADVGLPPYEYLTLLRIEKAKELLLAGKSSADIAIETGFSDQSHFIRRFKRQTGITPKGYIKNVL